MRASGDFINQVWAHKLPPLFAVIALLSALCSAQNLAPAQLYEQLSTVGLDPQNVITLRDASIDREDLHLSFSEGTVGLVRAVDGRVTGALFSGEGQILLIPPRPEEKQSMALFTGSAVLNERFTFAYLRFDDPSIVDLLKKASRPTPPPADFVEKYDSFAKNLAVLDALQLTEGLAAPSLQPSFLHARIVGSKLGIFDVLLDYKEQEQLLVAQIKPDSARPVIDVWAAFCVRSRRELDGTCKPFDEDLAVRHYRIDTTVDPSNLVTVEAKVTLRAEKSSGRIVLLHLGRSLQIVSAKYHGEPVPVLAPSGPNGRTEETFGLVMPASLQAGQEYEIELRYAGPILTDVGGGLVYVRERGKWYPTTVLSMADFDMTFHYPSGWQLLATGDRVEERIDGGTQFAHWRTSRPIPFAGFNLGHYVAAKVSAEAGMPEITSYATRQLEAALQPKVEAPAFEPMPPPGWHRRPPPRLPPAPPPPPPVIDPSQNALAVAQQAARTIAFLEPRLGKFPFQSLHVTQFPGGDSQGFAGLIYLSSLVFLNPEQRWRGHPPDEANATEIVFDRVMAAHETAHQWWGDSVFWDSYREQWLCEAFANYMALMQVEADTPEYFATMMDHYRTELIEPQRDTERRLKDAGAVSLGVRLDSSKYPNAYDAIAYGRGTWLIHMLRTMYRDAAAHPSSAVRTSGKARSAFRKPAAPPPSSDPDAAFFGVLRKLQEQFAGKSMATRDLRAAFEAALPQDLRFEGRKSLDWFFDEWVSGTAVPRIELKQVRFNKGPNRSVSFTITQSECPKTLITSVPIYIEKDSGPPVFLARVFADGLETEFRLDVPAYAKKLLLDPYRTVLRL
jgi:hypothetical protein